MPDSYDEIRYPSVPRDQSHPAYISALAMIAGLRLPPVERWRVLELGCGDGSNLLPLAFDYPEGRFLGIDRAREPLEAGLALASDLRLENLELCAADVMDWRPDGEFDYIIAHGVYSWVPPEVRAKILQICEERLKPLGIAFISYNALPGCHFRRFAWDLLRFHGRDKKDANAQIEEARALARMMASLPGDEPYQLVVRHEMETVLKRDAAALYHDDLSGRNDPFYLLDFVSQAAGYGLQYLGDADPQRDDIQDSPPLAEDWLEARQYGDFLAKRRFRETLLCRSGIALDRELSLERFGVLFCASQVRPGEARENGSQSFRLPNESNLTTNHPAAIDLLNRLSGTWPGSARLSEFSFDAFPSHVIADLLVKLVQSKALQVRIHPPRIAASVTERPVVSALARAQIVRGCRLVTNQRHQNVELEHEMGRKLLSLLDGSRDRDALLGDLAAMGANRESTGRTLETGLLELHLLSLLTG